MLLLVACGDGSDSGGGSGGGSAPAKEPFSTVSTTIVGDDGVSHDGVRIEQVDNPSIDATGLVTLPDDTIAGERVLVIGSPFVPGKSATGNMFGRDAPDITGVKLPARLLRIEDFAFHKTGLTSIEIPPTLTSIGDAAFRETKLTSIDIPDTVTSIGTQAFFNISTLRSVTLGSGLETIKDSAFSNCANLAEITLKGSTPPTLIRAVAGNQSSPIFIFKGTPFAVGGSGGTIRHPGIPRQDFIDAGWIDAVDPNTKFVDTTQQP